MDIGTIKDGLVHIKDVSSNYFISNLSKKFIPGQDIDVWVKFIDDGQKKLGLQMFPFNVDVITGQLQPSSTSAATTASIISTSSSRASKINLNQLYKGQEVTGTVVKYSDYGVYVDIGASSLAFLHRHKIKSNRRQRKYKSWELVPMNSPVDCYVYDVDVMRRRIGVTTYAPADWEDRFLERLSDRQDDSDDDEDDDDDDEDMVDDNEELGGDVRAANLKALKRTLDLNIDDDDDEDDDDGDDDDDDDGEELSSQEIQKLAMMGRTSKLVIDDFNVRSSSNNVLQTRVDSDSDDDDNKSNSNSKRVVVVAAAADDTEGIVDELSTDELFEMLSNGRSYLTISDIKNWSYLKQMITSGIIKMNAVHKIFRQAGAVQGKLMEEQFEDFVDMFSDALQLLNDDDDDENEDEVVDSNGDIGMTVEQDDNKNGVEVTNKRISDDDLDALIDTELNIDVEDDGHDDDDIVAADELDEDDSELMITSYIDDDDDNDDDLDASLDDGVRKTRSSSSGNAMMEQGLKPSKDIQQYLPSIAAKTDSTNNNNNNNLLSNLFQQLSNSKTFLEYADIIKWDFVKDLINQDISNSVLIRQAFNDCLSSMKQPIKKSTKNQIKSRQQTIDSQQQLLGLNSAAFDDFVSQLTVIERSTKSKSKVTSTDIINKDEDNDEDDEENDEENDEDDEEDDDDYEEISVDEEFATLADLNDGEYVTIESVSDWSLVRELIDEGYLTTNQLKDLFISASSKNKLFDTMSIADLKAKNIKKNEVLDIDGFNYLLDLLGQSL